MKFPISWLKEFIELPDHITASDISNALLKQGLEIESVEMFGQDIQGPIVVARVLSIEVLSEFKKPIRWCSVDAGEGEPRWLICGAQNFQIGDFVIVVKPGAVLPGGFQITARETYGKTSNGMICSAKELGLGDDHSGIIVLPADTASVGDDAIQLLGLKESVIDIAVTPDRGYALSMRGVAREVAIAFGIPFRDPIDSYQQLVLSKSLTCNIDDVTGADRLVVSTLENWNPSSQSPIWMQNRLVRCGMRSVSLAVDVTNYVMLELGQPLHAFDQEQVSGPLRVRRARSGEQLTTLDHVERNLSKDDLVIADETGPLALAGIMGGLQSEITNQTKNILLEAAHFTATAIASGVRRHKKGSEASRRFERGVDPCLQEFASMRAIQLLQENGGGTYSGSCLADHFDPVQKAILLPKDFITNLIGYQYEATVITTRLEEIGCRVIDSKSGWEVTPPSWRPDLSIPEDLAEEVARLEGYELIPSVLATPNASKGLTESQRLKRLLGRSLASSDLVEVLTYPFISSNSLDNMLVPQSDSRRSLIELVNPISETAPYLRTTLLPGLFEVALRNIGRGQRQIALFEVGSLFFAKSKSKSVPELGVEKSPTVAELNLLLESIPEQPWSVAGLLAGERSAQSWRGPGILADWSDAIAIAKYAISSAGIAVEVESTEFAPFHPGRTAALLVDGKIVGHAGELHPSVVRTFNLPSRTVAFEFNIDALTLTSKVAPQFSTASAAIQDIALIVPASTPASAITSTLHSGGGKLLERVELFDRYEGAGIPAGHISLAFTLTFRDESKTLTGEEIAAARESAVAAAVANFGAQLRG